MSNYLQIASGSSLVAERGAENKIKVFDVWVKHENKFKLEIPKDNILKCDKNSSSIQSIN